MGTQLLVWLLEVPLVSVTEVERPAWKPCWVAKGREEKEAGREPFGVWENGALPTGTEAGCFGGRSAAVERLSAERLRDVPAALLA